MPESARLREICLGIAMYRHRNGEFPGATDWQDMLIEAGCLEADDLVSPRGPLGPPAAVTRSHYVYFQLPPERDFDATALLVYENPAHYTKGSYTNGTFAVFADCHVDWVTLERLGDYLEAQADLPRSDRAHGYAGGVPG